MGEGRRAFSGYFGENVFMTNKKILVFSQYYLPGYKGGGPIKTISNMVKILSNKFDFYIVTSDRDLGDEVPYKEVKIGEWNYFDFGNVFYIEKRFFRFFYLFKLIRKFPGEIIHLNSFFSIEFSFIPLLIWKILRPSKEVVILGPRGEFSNAALKIKSGKKKLFIFIFKAFGLHKKIIWHASSNFEKNDIRRVLGNDVQIRVAIDIASSGFDLEKYRIKEYGLLKIVFLSRICTMKNLKGIAHVLSKVQSNVILDIYGPIEDENYWEECKIMLNKLPSNISYDYCGSVSSYLVQKIFLQYDLFFLPTLGENFGHVISEALGAGLPVLISKNTPWVDIEKENLGKDVELEDTEGFVEYIDLCSKKSEFEYGEWHKSIKKWALNKMVSKQSILDNENLFKGWGK